MATDMAALGAALMADMSAWGVALISVALIYMGITYIIRLSRSH